MTPHVHTAFLWSAAERFGQQLLQFIISVILARMLVPSAYGLVSVLLIFTAFAGVFADAGFSSGLIQRKTITADEETSIFYLNVTAGFVLTLALCAVSPLLAAFFRQPLLRPLLCVLSLQLCCSAFGIVQFALLAREVDFRTQAAISMAATLIAGGVGIVMAWRGCEAWSLVGQAVTRTALSSALVWVLRPWRPSGRFRWSCIRSLWPYSSRLLASNMLNTIFENIHTFVIGRLYHPADLGFFTRAVSVAHLPAGMVEISVGRVFFPILSRMQDDKAWLKEKFRKASRTLASVHFPVMAGLAAIAEPLVRCLMTEKWLPCVPYLQLLCFAGMLSPLHAMHLDVLIAQGRSDLFFRIEVIKRILTVLMLAATFRHGVMCMVWGIVALAVVCYFINSYTTRRMLGYGWLAQGRDLLPILAASLGMYAGTWALGRMLTVTNAERLSLQIAAGFAIYALIALAGRKGAYADLFNVSGLFWRKLTAAAHA